MAMGIGAGHQSLPSASEDHPMTSRPMATPRQYPISSRSLRLPAIDLLQQGTS